MDINPSNRPTASFICYELSRWHEVVDNGAVKDRYQLAILRTFQSANEIIPTLLTELPICPKDKLTSKRLSFNKLSKPINYSFISPAKSTNFY
ncbi:183_t:CDS:1, partial [Gigaspora rosea]